MATSSNKSSFSFRLEFPPELPISVRAEEITASIQAHQVIILAGETGSGKTTQIPKMCLAGGRGTRGRIACTQPRRVAALSVSRRVAEELGVPWGREVGCKIRFQDRTTPQTVIKFLTDGMLLAELQGDPLLREYDTIIVDEAHERSLNIDFVLGHLRSLRFRRPELKIIITSATIDTEAFSAAFDGAPVILVEGRTFPVEVIYSPLDSLGRDFNDDDENAADADASTVAAAKAEALHYIDGAVEAVERIVQAAGPPGAAGDILVFFPSERDIREAGDLLVGRRLPQCEIVPLFGRLSSTEQERVFASSQRRKIVLATNIAETSLTIPGIGFVVDTGLARLSRYSPQARTRRLPIEEISQSSADQRKGRSGRVAGGVCIRLFSEKDFLERPRFTQPEIQRANLADVILRMKAFGLGEIERFPFINLPASRAIRAGYALLEELGALDAAEPGATPRSGGAAAEAGEGAAPAAPEGFAGTRGLTPLGRELARLPVDPTVGRMILQARAERALREVLVIAAGLSIQDPRERPLERQQQADAAHRRFAHPDSDFLTLLNIWEAYHDEFESMSQARLRRFCREHFLSYPRMREWRDIHVQLLDVLRERDDFKMSSVLDGARAGGVAGAEPGAPRGRSPRAPEPAEARPLAWGTPGYRAIHRSILTGLLGNIAVRDEEKGGYKATHDRKVALFPGSVLYQREERKRTGSGDPVRGPVKKEMKTARWIMASEIMETTRLYARTAARLDPAWALELGAHLVRVAHSEPFWDEKAGRVAVKQRTRLYGLELDTRAVGFGRINPEHATELFIREGLVNDTIAFPLDCLTHNRAVRRKIEDLLTRARDSGALNLDEAAYRFYAARLLPKAQTATDLEHPRAFPATSQPFGEGAEGSHSAGVSTVAELVALVRARRAAEPRFLMMNPEDLRDPGTIPRDEGAYPAALPIENRALPLHYTYKPGQTDDGVTLDVSVGEAADLTPATLDWAVPGHLEAKVEHYLRALPKAVRVALARQNPLAESAKVLARQVASRDRLTGRRERLTQALAALILEGHRIAIDPAVWLDKPLPEYLSVRVRVLDGAGRELCASRDLGELQAGLAAYSHEASVAVAERDSPAWRAARAKWETPERASWEWDDLPLRVSVDEQGGVPVYAFPGLVARAGGVARRLFKTPEEARSATRPGLRALLESQLGTDLGWLERDLRALRELGALAATVAPLPELQEHAFATIRRWATNPDRVWGAGNATAAADRAAEIAGTLGRADFVAAVDQARAELRGLVPRLVDLLREILTVRQALLVHADPYPGLPGDLAALMPPDFLRSIPYERLKHLPRYLKAMQHRATRWRQNPSKDAERMAQVAPYVAALRRLGFGVPAAPAPVATRRGNVGAPSKRPGTGVPTPPDRAVQAFRWLVEEFRVSVFAQELGTAEPVSSVKLDRVLAELNFPGGEGPRSESPAVAPRAIVAAPVREGKSVALKNFGALDKLFPR